VFGLFLTPVFYVLLRTITGMKPLVHHTSDTRAAPVQGSVANPGH
jgi:multidrug efflux pump